MRRASISLNRMKEWGSGVAEGCDDVGALWNEGDAGVRTVALEGPGEPRFHRGDRGDEAAREGRGIDPLSIKQDLRTPRRLPQLVRLPLVGNEEAVVVGARHERPQIVVVEED